ncbi:hypothetical protein Poly24_06770 [Rosistilla carotiformis]|uniref:DUF1570 domain-containing protein n=1 Tax=Rosistilla carotiformis TaxID=2528017 RepID=A0A518JN58_9BACT|nr:DUF1570 domain-containing protein [Rosistilla carotiformis]QDV66986.1 hypothetical protein Poly24_06770 [Rosistilla carotiformis]
MLRNRNLIAWTFAVAFWILLSTVLTCGNVVASEHVQFVQDGKQYEVCGETLVVAKDGGRLFQANDGQIWMIQSDEIKDHKQDSTAVEIASPEAAVAQLLETLGDDFRVLQTAHYIVVSNANAPFVEYCAGLFEKLHKGFYAFWKNNGWDLPKPQFPLVALVFSDKASFQRYARPEAGPGAETIIGYYNLKTNRITTYDIGEGAGVRAGGFLVDRNIATIVHEATHQLAYNCGLQKRYADNPFWVSEGMAVFFESPDLKRGDGWREIGRINEVNRLRFAQYLPNRPANSLITLLQDDTRLTNTATAASAYAEAWALTYFLVKTKPKQYVAYLKQLSEGDYLDSLGPRERVQMFRDTFGDLETLDRQFIAYMRRFVLRR